MANPMFTTIGDMLNYFYGATSQIAKADAPVLTTTTGVYNPVFGAFAFSQLNNEANAWSVLPKYPHPRSGFRVITADAGSAASGGVAEAGTLPETIKPTFQEITPTTKQVVHTFESSYIQEGKVKKGDDAIGDMEFLRGYFANLHVKRINEMLLANANTAVAGDNFESLDRVCCSYSEVSSCSMTANRGDIYGLDRDAAASWSDAVVYHNSGTARVLTDSLIRGIIYDIKNNGGRTNVIVTGNDTAGRLAGLYDGQVRYMGVFKRDVLTQIGLNGVTTEDGVGVGIRIATIYNIPLIEAQSCVKDTISRIYFLDTTEQEGTGIPRLGISLMYPTLYFEAGMSANMPNPFILGKTSTKGMYYTAGELVCTFFKAQGKIRDLK